MIRAQRPLPARHPRADLPAPRERLAEVALDVVGRALDVVLQERIAIRIARRVVEARMAPGSAVPAARAPAARQFVRMRGRINEDMREGPRRRHAVQPGVLLEDTAAAAHPLARRHPATRAGNSSSAPAAGASRSHRAPARATAPRDTATPRAHSRRPAGAAGLIHRIETRGESARLEGLRLVLHEAQQRAPVHDDAMRVGLGLPPPAPRPRRSPRRPAGNAAAVRAARVAASASRPAPRACTRSARTRRVPAA